MMLAASTFVLLVLAFLLTIWAIFLLFPAYVHLLAPAATLALATSTLYYSLTSELYRSMVLYALALVVLLTAILTHLPLVRALFSIALLIPVLYANDVYGYGAPGILVGLPALWLASGFVSWLARPQPGHNLLSAPAALFRETRVAIPYSDTGAHTLTCTLTLQDLRVRPLARVLLLEGVYELYYNRITGSLNVRAQGAHVWRIEDFPLQTEVTIRLHRRPTGVLDIYVDDRLLHVYKPPVLPPPSHITPFLLVGERGGMKGWVTEIRSEVSMKTP